MTKYVDRLNITWLLLSGISILSWWLALDRAGHVVQLDTAITTTVIAFALIKARFIMREFMEVRTAPRSIKWLSDLWLAVLFALLIFIYRMA
jgi:hypothetical protein